MNLNELRKFIVDNGFKLNIKAIDLASGLYLRKVYTIEGLYKEVLDVKSVLQGLIEGQTDIESFNKRMEPNLRFNIDNTKVKNYNMSYKELCELETYLEELMFQLKKKIIRSDDKMISQNEDSLSSENKESDRLLFICSFSDFVKISNKSMVKEIHNEINKSKDFYGESIFDSDLKIYRHKLNLISNVKVFLIKESLSLKSRILNNLVEFIQKNKSIENKNNKIISEFKEFFLKLYSLSKNKQIKSIVIIINNSDKMLDYYLTININYSDNIIFSITICSINSFINYNLAEIRGVENARKFISPGPISKELYDNLYKVNKLIKNSIFIFVNFKIWSEIIYYFKEKGLIISGGSNIKKHLLNNREYKLSLFLESLFPQSYKNIVHSLNLTDKRVYQSKITEASKNKNLESEINYKKKMINYNLFGIANSGFYLENRFTPTIKNINIELNELYDYNEPEINIINEYVDNNFTNYNYLMENDLDSLPVPVGEDVLSEILFDKENENLNNVKPINNRYNNNSIINSNSKLRLREYHTTFSVLRQPVDASLKKESKNNLNNKLNLDSNNNSDLIEKANLNKYLDKPQILNSEGIENHLTRQDFFQKDGIISNNLSKIINKINNNSSPEDKKRVQIEIEELLIYYENNYINEVLLKNIENKYNPIRLEIIKTWSKKLNETLQALNDPYVKNKYSLLRKSIKNKKLESVLHLLILAKETNINKCKDKQGNIIEGKFENSFYNGHLINNIISIIVNILFFSEKEKKITVIMQMINKLLLRLPKKFPVLELTSNPKEGKFWEDSYKNLVLEMSEEYKISIATTFLEIILDKTDLLTESEPEYDSEDKKRYNFLSINKDYLELLKNKCFNLIKFPMVCEPEEWVTYGKESISNKYEQGGYITNTMRKFISHNSITNYNPKLLEQSTESNIQLNTINFLNKQKFRINKVMLNYYLNEFNDSQSVFFKGLNLLHPNTYNLDKKDINYSIKKKEVLSHNSKYYLNRIILEIAKILQNIDFYLPVFMDFRGRIYPVTSYFSYQGSDLERSLIEFAQGCYLNDNINNYVFQQLANTAGHSKLIIASKIKWSCQFIKDLNINFNNLNVKDVFNHPAVKNIITNSDEPGQFLTALINFLTCNLDKNYKFNSPICFDATCSGLQHLSALFSDIGMAMDSNVIPEINSDLPQDVYKNVAEHVKLKIINCSDLNLKLKLSKLDINRNLLKKPVMTVPYNVGLNTMQNQLIDSNFFEKRFEILNNLKTSYYIVNKKITKNKNNTVILTESEMGIFSSMLYTAIYEVYPSLKIYKKFLDDLINVVLKIENNKVFFWITPSNMKIKIAYRKYEGTKRGINLYNRKKRGPSITLPQLTLDYKTNKQAFMPNFIHSLDASNIHLLIKNLNDNKNKHINLYTIHDCFATTPDTMELLNKEVKLAFIKQYFDSLYLKEMYTNLISQIKSTVQLYKDEKSNKNYFITSKKEKVYIPDFPDTIYQNWSNNHNVFILNILKSTYFIN